MRERGWPAAAESRGELQPLRGGRHLAGGQPPLRQQVRLYDVNIFSGVLNIFLLADGGRLSVRWRISSLWTGSCTPACGTGGTASCPPSGRPRTWSTTTRWAQWARRVMITLSAAYHVFTLLPILAPTISSWLILHIHQLSVWLRSTFALLHGISDIACNLNLYFSTATNANMFWCQKRLW